MRLTIVQGTCEEPGDEVYSADVARGQSAPTTPSLPSRSYAFAAFASNQAGELQAFGCETAKLPQKRAITVLIEASEACLTQPDGGLDAATDGGMAPADGGMDAAVDGGDDGGCAEGWKMCGERCVDPLADNAHCGDCDDPCPTGSICTEGVCVCRQGEAICDDACVDLLSRVDYCGGCTKQCEAQQSLCVEGGCECPLGTSECSTGSGGETACVDLSADDNHCGECGVVCPASTSCTQGSCVCDGGGTYCGNANGGAGGCVDTDSDSQYCGDCVTSCTGGRLCQGGGCSCNAGGGGGTWCGNAAGGAGACVDTSSDEQFCGDCNTACPAGTVCQSGVCTCTTAGQTLCGTTCVNTSTSTSHCRSCNNSCTISGQVCGGSGCACPGANPTVCGNACVNTATDEFNCGDCGRTCSGSQTCQNGACVPSSAPAECSGFHYAGRDYLFCAEDRSWSSARSRCQGFGNWDLTVIGSSGENTALSDEGKRLSAGRSRWIGGSDSGGACLDSLCSCDRRGQGSGGEGDWYWLTPGGSQQGSLFCRKTSSGGSCTAQGSAYLSWAASKPDNAGACTPDTVVVTCEVGCGGSDEDCLRLSDSRSWDDGNCSTTAHFICEAY